MTTATRKAALQAAGYKIKNLCNVYGPQFDGQYRWLNDSHACDGFGEIQYSEAEAWADADQFEARYGF